MPPEEVSEARFAFGQFDAGGRGYISRRSMKVAARALGVPLRNKQLTELLHHLTGELPSDDMRIDMPLFERVLAACRAAISPDDKLREAFKLLDIYGTHPCMHPAHMVAQSCASIGRHG